MAKTGAIKKLTEKQELIFNYIKNVIITSGFPPTVREIGEKFNITVKGAYDHLKAIEKKGYIKTEQNKSRAIVIIGEDANAASANGINIPLLGRIAAGSPILAEENIEDYICMPQSMFANGEFFALTVKGDSMIDGGIYDGDTAIIKKQNTAKNGDVVAALLDDEATLKQFKLVGDKVHLVPQNSAYQPIITTEVTILGTLAAVFRKY